MLLKFSILGLLNFNDKTGYDITKILNSHDKIFKTTQPSQVYRDLNELQKKGYVMHSVVNQSDRPDKKVFSITDDGKKAFFAWLRKYPKNRTMNDPFVVYLFFRASRNLEDAIETLKKYKQEQLDNLEDMKNDKCGTSENDNKFRDGLEFWKLCILKSEYTCEANIRWADEAIEFLKSRL